MRILHTSALDNHANTLDQRLIDHVVSAGFPVAIYDAWVTDNSLDPIEGWTDLYRERTNWECLYRGEGYIAMVRLTSNTGQLWVKVSGANEDVCSAFVDRIRKAASPVVAEEGFISLKFWTNGHRGPQSVTRRIDAPNWEEIRHNYHSGTTEKLAHLVNGFKPAHGGQLLLWHGDPGTGKTYALRALVREWSKWCSAEYIVDPEAFFGSQPSYMMQVLLDSNNGPYWEDDDDEEEDGRNRWRLLIFEDTGELLSRDAQIRSGQGLSRLLNIVDGLIGQGLKVLILITTNEELGGLHAAVSRPGRAAVKAHFAPLEATEAGLWAARHDLTLPYDKRYTLAELYALRDGFAEAEGDTRRVGFTPLTAVRA